MPDWKILITDSLEENGLAILHAAARVDNRPDISTEEFAQITLIHKLPMPRPGRQKISLPRFQPLYVANLCGGESYNSK